MELLMFPSPMHPALGPLTRLTLLLLVLLSGGSPVAAGEPGEAAPRSVREDQRRLLDARVDAAKQATAERPDEPAALLDLAQALHFRGLPAFGGAADDTDAAAALLEALHAADPAAPLPAAYLGSVRLVQSARARMPWSKGKLATAGGELLQAAITAAPDDPQVRYVRGVSTIDLPERFGVREQARADLAAVAGLLAAAADEGRLDPWLAASAMLHHGHQLQQQGDDAAARAAWRVAVDHWPDTPAALQAKALLGER